MSLQTQSKCRVREFMTTCLAAARYWMQLLRQVAGSVLWLLGANEGAERNLRKEAGRVPDGGVHSAEPAASERAVIAP